MADDAVRCGPVSEPKFPASRELAGNFSKKAPPSHILASKTREVSKRYRKIPYSAEQGIFLPEQGILHREQGISEFLLPCSDCIVLSLNRHSLLAAELCIIVVESS
jgi:hypothetical protein